MNFVTLGVKNKCLEQKLKHEIFCIIKIINTLLKHAKYWQCVREQNISYLDNLMTFIVLTIEETKQRLNG